MTHAALKDLLDKYDHIRDHVGGCSDGGCVVKRPVGMHTNGGCKCSTDKFKAQRMMYAGQKLRYELSAALSAMEGEESEQSIKADAYDMVAEVLRERGLLDPGGSVVDTVRSLTAPPPQQVEKAHVLDLTESTDRINVTPSPGPQGGGEARRYTVERRGDGWAIYLGRDRSHHGLNLGHLTECSDELASHIEEGLNLTATPPAHQPGEVVTDEMVERYCKAAFGDLGWPHDFSPNAVATNRAMVRKNLTAALAPKEAGHGR